MGNSNPHRPTTRSEFLCYATTTSLVKFFSGIASFFISGGRSVTQRSRGRFTSVMSWTPLNIKWMLSRSLKTRQTACRWTPWFIFAARNSD